MIEVPVIGIWADMIILALVFVVLNRAVQHFASDPREYFRIKRRTKEINNELQVLYKQNKVKEVQEKQKESMDLVGKQFKLTMKPMFIMMLLVLPLIYVIKEYYAKFTYNFLLFTVNGFWAYIIIGFIISLVAQSVYDKALENKYK